MNAAFYPRYTVPAVLRGASIHFKPYRQAYYSLSANIELVWKILDTCDGYQPVESVLAEVQHEFPSLSAQFIREAIQELTTLGVLHDSRAGYRAFHDLTINPPYFSHDLSVKAIHAITKGARLPIKSGVAYALHQQTTGRLAAIQRRRRSIRTFDQRALPAGLLGHILISAYSLPLRSSPSAGALYPLKIYVILTANQADLLAGYYEYDPETHKLVRYSELLDSHQLQYAFNSDSLLGNAPAIVVIAADLERDPSKYGDRGYRFTLLEAGHAAQNMHLAAAEKRVSSLEYGGFLDNILREELQMNLDAADKRVQPLIAVALGFAEKKARPHGTGQKELLDNLKTYLIEEEKAVQTLSISRGLYPDSDPTLNAVSARATGQYATRPEKSFTASGTAVTAELAQIKALAEAYERYCSGLVRVDQVATADELTARLEQWIDPRKAAPLTKNQLSSLSNLQPFSPSIPWQWTRASRVVDGSRLWVPVDMVYYPLDTAPWDRKRCLAANSSGAAAHTDKNEAVKRGLLELIERHALMQQWFSRKAPPRVPTEKLPYHWQRRVAYWRAQGRHVHVLDISAFGVVAVQVAIGSSIWPCFITGAAASLTSFDEALAKAFTEAELPLGPMISQTTHLPPIRPEKVRTVEDHGKLYASPEYSRHLTWLWSGPKTVAPSVSVTYAQLLEKLHPAVVELSPEDAPLRVVRILSEKLIPITFGHGTAYYTHPAVEDLHPDSITLPHYFV